MTSVCGVATHVARLRQCARCKDLRATSWAHAQISQTLEKDKYLGNLLVQTYGQCGSVENAKIVFDRMNKRNVFSWNIMMVAYAQNGHRLQAGEMFNAMPQRDAVSWNAAIAAYASASNGHKAIYLFNCMSLEGIEPNRITFVSVIDAFTKLGDVAEGKVSIGQYWEDVSVGTSIIQMYAKSGAVDAAGVVFDMMPYRNVVTWTAIVAAYGRKGHLLYARQAFKKMPCKNIVSFTTMMVACFQGGEVEEGKLVFETMPQKDVIAWNSLIAELARSGKHSQALDVFFNMSISIDTCTCLAVLDACTTIQVAKQVHTKIKEGGVAHDTVVATALINMYSRFDDVDRALRVFRRMQQRNVVTWNSMIAAYARSGPTRKAILMFEKAPQRTLFTWNAALAAFALKGHMLEAASLVEAMPERSACTWNVMCAGYCNAGKREEAMRVSWHMQLDGQVADKITYITLIDACASLADMARGRAVHVDIEHDDASLTADLEICTSLVDMYGKCGGLENAVYIFASAPHRDLVLWTAMIAAYARNGYGGAAHLAFRAMVLEGGIPNEVTFMTIACACSHAGMYMDGLYYFGCMRRDYGITPSKTHYICTVDMLARLGKLNEAEQLIQSMSREDYMAWRAILSACETHGDGDVCARAASRLAELEPRNSMPYIFLSKHYKQT